MFRDQSELPTSGDLGSDIRQALLDSRYLIVVCSEETKNSLWCMEEIRMFKEAHRGHTDHILPLLVSGEPSKYFLWNCSGSRSGQKCPQMFLRRKKMTYEGKERADLA